LAGANPAIAAPPGAKTLSARLQGAESSAVASALAGMVSTVQLFIMQKLIENVRIKILKKVI